jgi:hypothetical protein
VPGALTVKGSEVLVKVTGFSGLVDVKTWTVQAASLKSWKVTVPVGAKPPARVARSRSWSPTLAVLGSASVPMTGSTLATTTCSSGSRQPVGPAGLLLTSPL